MHGDLLELVRARIALSAFAGRFVAVAVRSDSVAAGSGLRCTTVAEPFRDHRTVELSKDTKDLAYRRPHRVVGVIAQDFARIGGEHLSTELPADRQRSFLHG